MIFSGKNYLYNILVSMFAQIFQEILNDQVPELSQFVQVGTIDGEFLCEILYHNGIIFVNYNDKYYKVIDRLTWRILCNCFNFEIEAFIGYNIIHQQQFEIDYRTIMNDEVFRLYDNDTGFNIQAS